MGSLLNREPAVIIATVTAFIVQLFAILALFGLNLPEDVRMALLAIVEPVVILIFSLGVIIRANVFAPATVEHMEAKQRMHQAWMAQTSALGVQSGRPTSPDPSLPR